MLRKRFSLNENKNLQNKAIEVIIYKFSFWEFTLYILCWDRCRWFWTLKLFHIVKNIVSKREFITYPYCWIRGKTLICFQSPDPSNCLSEKPSSFWHFSKSSYFLVLLTFSNLDTILFSREEGLLEYLSRWNLKR